ncbi:MAG TPA: pyrimidine reductase family protein [Miltoncostaea sp.]|nr:pyrimidine reductase family protein [Miltoncostaea sp.]
MRRLLPGPAAEVSPAEAYADVPVATGRPGVRVNMVASLDGAITVEGRSGGLGGDADWRVFMALRALADVILVGAGTVRNEGYGPPRLDDEVQAARRERGQARLPRIAVVTRSLTLDWDSRFFAEAPDDARPLVLTCAAAPEDGRRRAAEVAELVVAGDDDVDVGEALARLGGQGVASVLCEGGPYLNRALAADGLLDELCLTVSPLLVGGAGPRMLAGAAPSPGGVPMALHAAYEDEGFLFLRHRAGAAERV